MAEADVLARLPLAAQITAVTRAVLCRSYKTDLTPLLKSRPDGALRSLNAAAQPTADGEPAVFDGCAKACISYTSSRCSQATYAGPGPSPTNPRKVSLSM